MDTTINNKIRELALTEGFDLCGFTSLDPLYEHQAYLERWINTQSNADMAWFHRNSDKRIHPSLLVPEAHSAIILLSSYYTSPERNEPNEASFKETTSAKIARYARFKSDYHDSLNQRLNAFSQQINMYFPGAALKHYTDTGPILERALAHKAGLGWIGKNTCLIVPGKGSYFFISVLFSTLNLTADLPIVEDHCGTCVKCISACPTFALIGPRFLDARSCISYHTIESKKEIPSSISSQLMNNIFGCDICQEVCPHNRKPYESKNLFAEINSKLSQLSDDDYESLSHDRFLSLFRNTPIHRTGYNRFMRNIQAYLKNRGDI